MNTSHIRSATRPALRGFTLIETLITVSILVVLMSVAVPSFLETIRTNRLASQANELVKTLTLARSEAIKRRMPVSVCARNGAACATGAAARNWSGGWLVFTDDLSPFGQIDAPTDQVLLSSPPSESIVSITSDVDTVTYEATGTRSTATLTVNLSGCTGQNKRVISVELTGRVSLKKEAC